MVTIDNELGQIENKSEKNLEEVLTIVVEWSKNREKLNFSLSDEVR